jgi:hypothetical protein
MPERPDITPQLTVAHFLAAYPELEETLVGMAPAFAKLRNPLLRRTVARMTSLGQAAGVGGLAVGELIGALRAAAGLESATTTPPGAGPSADEPRPDWFDGATVVATFDARPVIEAGEVPMARILAALDELAPGEVFTFVTPFVPAPIRECITAKGYRVWTEAVADTEFRTHCTPAPRA